MPLSGGVEKPHGEGVGMGEQPWRWEGKGYGAIRSVTGVRVGGGGDWLKGGMG